MKAFHHFRQIHHRAYVRAVGSTTRQPSSAQLPDQVGTAAGSKRRHHRLTMPVVENQLKGILSEARFLLLPWLVETIVIQLDVEASGKQHRAIVQGAGIA